MSERVTETYTSTTARRFSVLVPFIFALFVVWKNYRLPGVSADGVTYLQIARNILMGKGLGWQALWVPPLHSILIAGASCLTGTKDLLAAAGLVSLFMYFCLVPAVYWLALEAFDLRTALVAAILTSLFPQMIFIAFSTEAEITYTFFLVLSLLFFMRSITRQRAAYSAASGVCFALAWMARSEGFIVMALVFVCATLMQGRRFYVSTVFRYCLLSTLLFTLVASPYLLFLHKHYGRVVISPKSSYVLIWMKSRIYHDNDKGEMGNDELWGLTPDGSKLRWQEPKGVTDLLAYLMSHPAKSIAVYFHNLGLEVPGRIPNNSGMERYPQSYPVYFTLAALLAGCCGWGRFGREKRAVLVAPFLILFILPLFTEGWWKYLIPYLPVLTILAARGFSVGSALVADRLVGGNALRMGAILLTVGTAAIGTRYYLAVHPVSLGSAAAVSSAPSSDIAARLNLADEARKAGQWGARRFGSGKNYMAAWSKIIYYLDGSWTALPVAEYQDLLAYARLNGVDFVVVELAGEQSRLAPEQAPGLEVAARYLSSTYPYAVVFYRVLPP